MAYIVMASHLVNAPLALYIVMAFYLANAPLAGAEAPKVLGSSRHLVCKELDLDPPELLHAPKVATDQPIDCDFKEDVRVQTNLFLLIFGGVCFVNESPCRGTMSQGGAPSAWWVRGCYQGACACSP